jgi:hypothetical protein
MSIHVLDPLTDSRWDDLVARHPQASAFHLRGWLDSLARTYGYTPLALTSTPPGQPLTDSVVLCRVSSWITGTRLVSLPFADHCEPLFGERSDPREFAGWLLEEYKGKRCKYVELRPLTASPDLRLDFPQGASFSFHTLDLTPNAADLFRGFHKDSVQRRIRRAEKAGLDYEVGRSKKMLEEFYSLMLKTRRRHQMFPQPRPWFTNLFACMGENAEVRVARKDGTPVASLLTLRHRSTVIYKYGCSDEAFNNLGATPLLFWRLIEESKATGATELDFGRSDTNNQGLVTFKDRFGTRKTQLTYVRYPQGKKNATPDSWAVRTVRQLFSILPDSISPVAGSLLYRHIG